MSGIGFLLESAKKINSIVILVLQQIDFEYVVHVIYLFNY